MHESMLELLRCPFCGGRVSLVGNEALIRNAGRIESGVLGCECCAFPVVAGIPVMIADDPTREAMHLLEAGNGEAALFTLLNLEGARVEAFRRLMARPTGATYQEMLAILSRDAEGTCFVYRFSDPTFVMAEALLQVIGGRPWTLAGRFLDICGGTGHLTRVMAGLRPARGTVLADLFFWKLWLARRFCAPASEPVCCDGNQPLPFARELFSMVVLADAFPYIWHKRLLADEMMRVSAGDGVIVMPHLHSALGDNFSAGNTLTPAAYRDLFELRQPHLLSDERLLTQVLDRRLVDLSQDATLDEIGAEPSFTLVAGGRPDLFQCFELPGVPRVTGELKVNPLYQVERRGSVSILTLTFPTPEYEEEFGGCRRYLPDRVTVDADVTGTIVPGVLGARLEELLRRRIIIDVPPGYC